MIFSKFEGANEQSVCRGGVGLYALRLMLRAKAQRPGQRQASAYHSLSSSSMPTGSSQRAAAEYWT
jgi:hypothetical protein